ncbi:Unknown protein, partial [Striga hermonthica]
GGRTTSHATSQPRDRMSQPPPEQNTRRTDAGRNPPVLPKEETAESQSGHSRRSPPLAQCRNPSNPAQTDLRQHIERNWARQESSELETLRRRIAELESRQRAPEDPPRRASTSAQVYLEADSPLTPELTSEPVPGKVKVPQIGLYDGTSDPDSHLGHYTSWMDLHGASDALRCRMFSLTLGPRAQKWYHSLPPHLIWKWQQLRSAFRSHFIGAQVCLIPKESLANITQKDDESVKDYIARFNDRSPGHNTDECLSLLAALLRLIGHPQLTKFYRNTDPQRQGPGRQIEPFDDEDDEEDRGAMPKRIRQGDKEVFMFTSEMSDSNSAGTSRGRKRDRSPEPIRITVHRVNTNNPRSTLSRRQVKAYARRAHNSGKQVYTTDLRDILNNRNCPITFNMEDANHFAHPHSDALVITVPICGIPVHRVMVDSGAYSSILMLRAFDKMGLDPAEIRPCNDQIQGFNGSISKPIGEITLPVRFGTSENATKLVMETFKVMDINNEYNAIIGRTAFYKLRAAVSIFHYALKFPTTRGEGTHFGDQREARELVTFIPSNGVHSTSM